jgi:hypothetical protein
LVSSHCRIVSKFYDCRKCTYYNCFLRSVQQTLRPPSEFYEQSFFGAAIDLEDTEQRMLVVGCKGCNATFADGGALFLFEPTSPKASLWTQTAMLTTTADLFTLGSSNVVINKGVIVADAMDGLSGAAVKNAIVFTKEGPNRWTQQQELNIGAATTHSITDVTVFDETIIVGAGAATVNTITNAGQVNVFYPSTARFHLEPKGKPQPTQWSLQQVLIAPSVTQDFNFGDSVSMDGNRLAIADGGATSTKFYLYRREEVHGRWSLQQTITSAPAGQIAGLKLIDNSVAVVEKTTTTLQIWDETTAWDCLIVSMEDHFNDGWDGMSLEIETPNGEKDVFTSRCDTANPFQFRWVFSRFISSLHILMSFQPLVDTALPVKMTTASTSSVLPVPRRPSSTGKCSGGFMRRLMAIGTPESGTPRWTFIGARH